MQLGEIIVTDDGIEEVDAVFDDEDLYCSRVLIPKKVFVEAYEKWIKGET